MTKLEQAIATIEGYFSKGIRNRPQRNFNPGDIRWGDFARSHGATHGDPDMAVFPDEATGFAALHALLATDSYRNLTIQSAINRYAPPNENNTVNYVHFVCERADCRPQDIVSEVQARG